MLRRALFEIDGPVALRYPRGTEGAFRENTSDKPIVRLREGTDVTLLAYGVMIHHALEAAGILAQQGVSAEVLKLNQVSPLNFELLEEFFGNTDCLLVAEDSFGGGCVGQRITAILAERGKAPGTVILRNLGKTFASEGSVPQLEHQFGLDAEGLAKAVLEARENGK